MQPLKAHVQNGRLVLDEPTDLPEGEVVYVHPVVGIVGAGEDDGLEPADRAALHRELEGAIVEADTGETVSFGKLISELRQRP